MEFSRFLTDISGLTQQETCSAGIYECGYLAASSLKSLPKDVNGVCAPFDNEYVSVENNYAILIIASIGMAIMAFSIGANDGANAWATSVHSFAISLKHAVLLGAFLEALGAATLGYGVSTSIQRGITNPTDPKCFACGRCDSDITVYYVGMLCALFTAGTYVIVCSWLKLPVSSTHSIIGAVVGVTITAVGFDCLSWGWKNLGGIIGSWIISPFIGAAGAVIVYYVTDYFIFRSRSPRRAALITLPALYFVIIFFIVYLSMIKSPSLKTLAKYWSVVGGCIGGGIAGLLAIFFILPHVKRNMPSANAANRLRLENLVNPRKKGANSTINGDGDKPGVVVVGNHNNHKNDISPSVYTAGGDLSESPAGKARNGNFLDASSVLNPAGDADDAQAMADADDRPLEVIREYEQLSEEQEDAMWMFKYLLIIAACLESYAHGSNETANATAPFSAVISGFKSGRYGCANPESDWWIMLIGGSFLGLGIIVLGYKVMETLGKDLALFNYHRGFCVELASASTVVLASVLELPVSSTPIQVGCVAAIGVCAFGWRSIKWRLLSGIFGVWVITVPVNALLAGLVTYLVQFALRG